MKKIYSSLIMLVTGIVAMGLAACSSESTEEEQLANDEVKVCFIYTLDTSNGTAMTRATGNDAVFNEFYEKIKMGELVAPTYDLTLTEVNTGATYSFKGNWASHDLVTLRTGTYHVVGTSKAEGDNIQEKCSFTFDEQIDINITSSTVTLHANYDCSLLIFNNADIKSLQNYNGESLAPFFTFKTYRYAFVNGQLYLDNKRSDAYILGQYTSNAEFKVFTGYLTFEKGKYYVYNSVSNGFDIPPMEEGSETADKSGSIDGRDYVDLGLSSGTLWATCNVGADSPEESGDYYAWGETTTKSTYKWSTYKYCEGSETTLTKYCTDSSYGTVDNLTDLELEDDAAYVNWGSEWRMPSYEQYIELSTQCSCEWVTINEKIGLKITGINGNFIFLPVTGYKVSNTSYDTGITGNYWSCSLYPESPESPYVLDFTKEKGGIYWNGDYERFVGRSIRPVRNSKN